MTTMDARQELIEKAREAARRLGKSTLTLKEFRREARIGSHQVYAHFEDWRDLCRRAGLGTARPNDRIPDDELYGAMRDAFVEAGGVVNSVAFRRRFRYDLGTIYRRGMGWPGALFAFRQWAEENAPDFPYLDQLPVGPPRGGRALGNLQSERLNKIGSLAGV